MDFDISTIRDVLLNVGLLIISLSLHEWGHAFVADRLGDRTPRMQGRVTLNPLPHIDLLGTIVIPALASLGLFGGLGVIGWAKPVETNPSAFKNGMSDRAKVTIAGPAMNMLLALVATLLILVAERTRPEMAPLFVTFLRLNVMLVVFNLIPVPPLDGSKFLMYWFGMKEETYIRFAQWGWLVLLLLINLAPFRMLLGYAYGVCMLPFELLLRAAG